MNPFIIVFGLLFFILCLMSHVLVWRLKRPNHEIAALFINFIIAPLLVLFVLYFSFLKTMRLTDVVAVYLFHFALAGAYISTYPAVQAYSPSLEILMLYRGRKSRGFTKDEILNTFDKMGIVSDRVSDLKHSRLVIEEDGRFRLSRISQIIIFGYKLYRSCLGLPTKGK
jgi:hypothetical protein